MKEFEKQNLVSIKTQIESVVKKQKQQEFKFLDNLRPLAGHNLWEINTKTLEVNLASFKKESFITWSDALRLFKGGKITKEVVVKQGYVYISALTKEKALERYLSGKGSAKMNEFKNLNFY
jgi:hypothetical protein